MYRVTRFGLVVVSLALCLASCKEDKDRNSKWRTNEDLLKNTNDYYFSLAEFTTDVDSKPKRFMSVLSQALLYNGASENPNRLQRVHDAVERTRAQLQKPVDAIGGQTRTMLSLIRAIIDQPINDVKEACKPDTEEADCQRKLRLLRDANQKACKEYDRNVYLYDKSVDLFTDPDYFSFREEVSELSDMSDEVALSYFTNIALVKYPKLVQKSRNLYHLRANTTYSCDMSKLAIY